jgi:hypothetical protein
VGPVRRKIEGNASLVKAVVRVCDDPVSGYLNDIKENGDADLKESEEMLAIKQIVVEKVMPDESLRRELNYNIDLFWNEKVTDSILASKAPDSMFILRRLMENM